MAISGSDILTRLSGGSSNSDPNASLGGAVSTTNWSGGSLHDLFDIVSGDENAASESEYRCIYIRNNHGSLTYEGVRVWISSEVSGGASIAIGLGASSGAAASTTPTATSIANEDTAPGGVSFSSPTTKGTGLNVGNIGPSRAFPIWIRRTTANTAAKNNDGVTLAIEGDTAE